MLDPAPACLMSAYIKRVQRIEQTWNSPVEHVIIRQDATIDVWRYKPSDILRAHFVVDVLSLPRCVTARNRCF